jgi:hypothetical protein
MDDPGLVSLFLGWALVVGIGLPVWSRARARRFNAALTVGLEHMQRGRLAEARDCFTNLRKQCGTRSRFFKVAQYDLALVELRSGNPRQAIELLLLLERRGDLPASIHHAVASTLAYIFGLVGDLAQAQQWLAVAGRRPGPVGLPHPHILTESVLELRRGNAMTVVNRLDTEWRVLEETRKGETLRPLRLLRAFGAAHSPTSMPDARDPSRVEPLLHALRPVRAGEFDYLGVEWSELRAFLAEHQLR